MSLSFPELDSLDDLDLNIDLKVEDTNRPGKTITTKTPALAFLLFFLPLSFHLFPLELFQKLLIRFRGGHSAYLKALQQILL